VPLATLADALAAGWAYRNTGSGGGGGGGCGHNYSGAQSVGAALGPLLAATCEERPHLRAQADQLAGLLYLRAQHDEGRR
jgi:hypothetical protein